MRGERQTRCGKPRMLDRPAAPHPGQQDVGIQSPGDWHTHAIAQSDPTAGKCSSLIQYDAVAGADAEPNRAPSNPTIQRAPAHAAIRAAQARAMVVQRGFSTNGNTWRECDARLSAQQESASIR